MNILFVCGSHLNCNSGIHTFNLANALVDLGHECVVCVPDQPELTAELGLARFRTFLSADIIREPHVFSDDGTPDLVHAWTPRETVRIATEAIVGRVGCPYVVHMEDNEGHLTESAIGRALSELEGMPQDLLASLIPLHLSHPILYKEFIFRAAGVTALLDTLLDFKPPTVPGCVFWPAADESLIWDASVDKEFRDAIGVRSGEKVVSYTGNVHAANRKEVASLYLAIAIVNRRGRAVRLVRTGIDYVPLFDNESRRHVASDVIELGFIPRADIPKVLSMADVLVQPGRADAFNDFRFPSKLPEFFASGRVVILPKTNLGRYVEDGVNCRLMQVGDATEIARILEEVLSDHERHRHIGVNAKAFANLHFRWPENARKVSQLYLKIMDSQ